MVAPKLIRPITAKYTKEALRAGVANDVSVVLRIIIDDHGNPQGIKVLKSAGYGLDEEATKAAMKAKFKPAEKDGKAVGFVVRMEVNFSNR